jgi:8-oxo-dGTP pyrophosphatase MutT (NUDIX family)
MTAAIARPSTTVLLVRDGAAGLEVLMVVRRDDRSQYGAALVFPGGAIEAGDAEEEWLPLCTGLDGLDADERTRRIAGLRELYEEAGILLLDGSGPAAWAPRPAVSFLEAVRASGGRLDLAAMAPFAHWVTPEGAPKRFDTFFRLCWQPTRMEARSDGRETVAAEWLRPAEAIALGAAGERHLLFPTKCQLDLLAQTPSVPDAITAARTRRIVPVSPRIERGPGGTILSIPPEAGYPVCAFVMPGPRPA